MTNMDTRMCIYQIAHKQTGKKYIGQTTQKLSVRWQQHYTKSHCVKLYSAIKKHGKELFDLTELNTLSPNGYDDIRAKMRARQLGKAIILSEEGKRKVSEGLVLYHSTISPEAKAARIAKANATKAANKLAKQQQAGI